MSLSSVNTTVGASVSIENQKNKLVLGNATDIVCQALSNVLRRNDLEGVGLYPSPCIALSYILEDCKSIIANNAKCVAVEPFPDSKEYKNITLGGEVDFNHSLNNLKKAKELFIEYLRKTSGVANDGLSNLESMFKSEGSLWAQPKHLNNIYREIGMGVKWDNMIKYTSTVQKREFHIAKQAQVDTGCEFGVMSVLHESALAKTSDDFNDIVSDFISAAAKKYLPEESGKSDDKQNYDVVEDIENELYDQAWKTDSELQNFLSFLFDGAFSFGRRHVESFMMKKLIEREVCFKETVQYFDYVYQLIEDLNKDKIVKFSYDKLSRRIGGGTKGLECVEFDPVLDMGINRLFYYLPVCLHQPSALSEKSEVFEWQVVSERTTTLKSKINGRMNHDFNDSVNYVLNNKVGKLKLTTANETPHAIKILTVLDNISLLYKRLQEAGIGVFIDDSDLGSIRRHTREVLSLTLANPFFFDGKEADFNYRFYEFVKKKLEVDCPLLLLEMLSQACLYMYCAHTNNRITDEKIIIKFNRFFNIEKIFTEKIVGDVIKVLKTAGDNPVKIGLSIKVANSLINNDGIKKWSNTILGTKIKNLPQLIKGERNKFYENSIEWASHLSFECDEGGAGGLDFTLQKEDDYWFYLRREYTLSAFDVCLTNENTVSSMDTSTAGMVLPMCIVTSPIRPCTPKFLALTIDPRYFDDSVYKKGNQPCMQKLVMRDMCFNVILHLLFNLIKERAFSKTTRKISLLRIHTKEEEGMNNVSFQSCINSVIMNSGEMMVSVQGVDMTTGGNLDYKPLNILSSMLKKMTSKHTSPAITSYCQDSFSVIAFLTIRTSYQKGWEKTHTLTCQAYFVNKEYFLPKFTISLNETSGSNSRWLLVEQLITIIREHTKGLELSLKDIVLIYRTKNGKRMNYSGVSQQELFAESTLKNINEKYKDLSIIPLRMDENYFLASPYAKSKIGTKSVLVFKDTSRLDMLNEESERVVTPIVGYATMKTVGSDKNRFYNSMNLLYLDKNQIGQHNLININKVFIDALSDIFLLSAVNESENRSVVMNPYAWIRPKESKYAGEVTYRNNGFSLTINQAAICAALDGISVQSRAGGKTVKSLSDKSSEGSVL